MERAVLSLFTFALLSTMLIPFAMMDAYAGIPGQTEHIVNGDFETGTFAGWTQFDSGLGLGFRINDGSLTFPGPQNPTAPISGTYDAVSSQTGPALNMLSEVFTVPSGIISSTVSWEDRIFNHANSFSDPNQEVRIEIRDSTGVNVLLQLYSTNPGDPLTQAGPNIRSFDLTAFMQANEGVDIRFCIVQQDNLNWFNYFIDNISLTTDDLPVGGHIIPIDQTALLLAGVQSISMWMIPVVVSGAGIGVFVIMRTRK